MVRKRKPPPETLRPLPRKDQIALIFSMLVVCLPMAMAAYEVYLNNQPIIIEFKVFKKTVYYYPNLKDHQTQILTWGSGKYFFVGNWTNNFELDHTYRVKCVHRTDAPREYQYLIILELEDIT